MDFSLAVKNIVIVGDFNPGLFDKYFFIKHSILLEQDILETSHFLSDVCILNTNEFALTIVGNQLAITDLKSDLNIQKIIEVLKKIISVGQYQARAMGVNFHWYLFSEEKTSEISKKYFYNENEILTNTFFNEENVSYGIYLSKDFGLSRMKLDIKPATVTQIGSENEQRVIAFTFNFHSDLKNENTNQVMNILDQSNNYCEETIKIIKSYEFK